MIAINPIHIIVVGAGLIGPRHAEHVIKNSQTELFGIVDPSPSAKEVASRLNTLYFKCIKDVIDYCEENSIPIPDGAIVATPNHTHVKVAAELAYFGIHLLVEKPLGSNPQEAKALKDFANSKNVKLLVGHHRRFNPFIIETKNQLHKIGNIIAVQGTWTLRKPQSYFDQSPWRTNHETGGGPLLINLVHDLDVLQFLFGPIEKIYAELLKKQRLEYSDNVDEGAALTIRFKNGITGTFICSDNVTSPFNFECGTGENPTIPLHEDLQGFYRIFGSKGTLSVPDLNLFHQADDKEEEQSTTTGDKSWLHPIEKKSLIDINELRTLQPFDLQLNHFVDIIRGKAEPLCTADDGISASLCIEAVLKSIETDIPQYIADMKSISPDYHALGYVHDKTVQATVTTNTNTK
ncbi:oxidoreductase [Scheffersomyces coipomensis]|uniref:oxidoreductase n=1 Tax=Scheffersomyces coipomensis TaxID=1788519 RepID=UPI00315CF6FD